MNIHIHHWFQEKALKYTERLAISKNLDIFEGMSLINTGSARSARSYEPLSAEPKARELQIDERIADNVADFLENHVLQLSLTEPDNESRGLDEEGMLYDEFIYLVLALLLSWSNFHSSRLYVSVFTSLYDMTFALFLISSKNAFLGPSSLFSFQFQ